MVYIENIYICLAAPILIAYFFTPKEHKRYIIFSICGMSACLLSAYINMFFAKIYGTEIAVATIEIAPLIEETMKLLPILFYLIIFEPKDNSVISSMLISAVSFASFENICYLVEHGTENLEYLLIRGFGTGAMHIVCGAIVGYGLLFTWSKSWLRAVGTLGVLCIAVTFHAQYNLLMSAGGILQIIGFIMPIATIFIVRIFKN